MIRVGSRVEHNSAKGSLGTVTLIDPDNGWKKYGNWVHVNWDAYGPDEHPGCNLRVISQPILPDYAEYYQAVTEMEG